MSKSLVKERKEDSLVLDRALLKTIYQHTRFLANYRFLRPVQVLQSRNVGYEIEDFVQEVVQKVCDLFKTKSFPTINHLKSMIRQTMEFHYLHEKRKYFYTKSRGIFSYLSLEMQVSENRKLQDILPEETKIEPDDLYNFNIVQSKHLYVAYDWKNAVVIRSNQLKDYANKYVLSVNFFIEKLKGYGYRETCKYFKNNGFYMTRTICEQISDTILAYLKDNDYIKYEDYRKRKVITRLENCYNKSLELTDDEPIKKLLKV